MRRVVRGLIVAMWGLAACGGDSDSTGPLPDPQWPRLGCDPLVPSYCAFPFPSNVYTVEDPSTPTGRRLDLAPELMPVDYYGTATAPDPWNALDGFSSGVPMMAHFPGVTPESLEGVPTSIDIERSLEDDSPTVLLDAETKERVPHWVDLDATGSDDGQRTFMIRPAVRLADGRRYIVAVRGLVDGDGRPVEPSEAFEALRDDLDSTDESVERRRDLYANIFGLLEEAGVPRDDLILAWDFTTSSRENNTAWMVHMRDESLALLGDEGPAFEVTSVETDWETEHIAYRIYGLMTVPMYLDTPDPGATLHFGSDGLPEPHPDHPWAQFEVEIVIPHSATQAPAALLQYGHGLLGEKEQIESAHFRSFIDEYNYILFGVDFIGFADDDELPIGAILSSGRFEGFARVIDRQHQGMLNSLLAMRMMKTTFAQHPDFGSMVDPSRAYYHGISQGGIYGAVYMALSTDVTRGALGVMGMPYNLLLSRSVDFDRFFDIVRASYRDARDQMFLLALAQMLWDRIEPNGYAPYIRENTLPNTPPHEVLMRDALGDHQVTTLGAHIMARAIGVAHVDTGLRDIFLLEKVQAPYEGSGLVEYSFGLPPDPVGNVPQRECEDPHGKVRTLEPARKQLDAFLRTGVVENHCPGGVCDFSDMSGC